MIKEKYFIHKNLIDNFIWRSIQTIGKQGINLIIFILAARILTIYEFGIYNYLLAVIFFVIIFSDFGISSATSKYIAEYNSLDRSKANSILINSLIIIGLLSLIITIIILIISRIYLKDNYIYLIYLLPLIFLVPLVSLYDGIYRGLKKFKSLAIITLIAGTLSLLFIYPLIKNYGLIGAIIAQNLFYIILAASLFLGYRDFNLNLNKNIMSDVMKYSIIIGFADFGYFIFSRVNTLILGHYNLILETAYYEVINKIFFLFMLPFTIFAQIIAPDITSNFYQKRYNYIKSKLLRYSSYSLIVSLLFSLILFFILPDIIDLFFSKYNLPSLILAMRLLLIVLVSQSIGTIVAVGFSTPTGYAKLNMYWLIFFGSINIPLAALLVNMYGFMGIIYSTIIIKILCDTTFILYYIKVIKRGLKNEKN